MIDLKEKRMQRKIDSLMALVESQEKQINELQIENSQLEEDLENERSLAGDLHDMLRELEEKQKIINEEYSKVGQIREEYRNALLEISTIKKEYVKKLNDIVKETKKNKKFRI